MDFIIPNWEAPRHIMAITTTRTGGFSQAPYDGFNLATHVGDQDECTEKNRLLLSQIAHLPEQPRWLTQTHSNIVINSHDWEKTIEADAIYSQQPNHVCAVMTADCLPVLLCNESGTWVSAVHAGWRGLANGIISKTVAQYDGNEPLMAWLGPAIGPQKFEVGHDVYDNFIQQDQHYQSAFIPTDEQHFLANIYCLARHQLSQLGIDNITGGDHCTYEQNELFFSYRRDRQTGRMATIIWIDNK